MIKKTITLYMVCLILMGSVIFPLGDLSLVRDLPDMYRNYSKITTPEELGVLDFIGDYLLHGKEIFGHNAHDKHQGASNDVQFQHQPNPLCIALHTTSYFTFVASEVEKIHTVCNKPIATTNYRQKLFRPPLA
jgi:hypothetical protein